jgi:hypothetical protein
MLKFCLIYRASRTFSGSLWIGHFHVDFTEMLWRCKWDLSWVREYNIKYPLVN